MEGTPEELYANFDTKGLSHFITEKFGTSTFLHQHKKTEIRYELTPLRTEGEYGDFRHPSEIQRSNDLIVDSQRRDFTINAMYYFSTTKQTKADLDFTQEGKPIDEKNLIKILEREGYCYLANLNLLILHNKQYIQQVFGNAKFDETYFRYLVETQREGYFRTTPFLKGGGTLNEVKGTGDFVEVNETLELSPDFSLLINNKTKKKLI
jgi:hypothetical protein